MTPGEGTDGLIRGYLRRISALLEAVEATDGQGRPLALAAAVDWMMSDARQTHRVGGKLMFIGNGGSAATASHMANDFSKNGGMRALALNDSAVLTCLGNDFGYEHVFAKQIDLHARPGDLLVIFSASGRSPNVLNAVASARKAECRVVTFSGFAADNPLRRLGDVNLYVPSPEYGPVESAHMVIIAMVLDLAMGWGREQAAPRQ